MNFLENCSILTGVATLHNELYVTVMNDGLAEERRQHAIPLLFSNDKWSPISDEPLLPWLVAGIARMDQPSLRTVLVGWGGQVLVIEGDTCHREAILRKDSGYVSIIRSVVSIDDAFYAIGMRRQVYKKTEKNNWVEIDHDVEYQGDRIDIGFNAIDGFSHDEIYAAGSNGEIWWYDNQKWREVQTPSNVHLYSLCCAVDGYVYASGKSGILIRGRHDAWEVLDVDLKETIWDIHWFGDKLYLITNTGVYHYNERTIEKVQNELLHYEDFSRFSSSKDKLWIFGRKRIIQYDGIKWSECISFLSDDVLSASILDFFNDNVLLIGSDYLED